MQLPAILTYLRARCDRDQEGASMVEYGLLLALIAIVAIVALETVGDGVFNIFGDAAVELGEDAPTQP